MRKMLIIVAMLALAIVPALADGGDESTPPNLDAGTNQGLLDANGLGAWMDVNVTVMPWVRVTWGEASHNIAVNPAPGAGADYGNYNGIRTSLDVMSNTDVTITTIEGWTDWLVANGITPKNIGSHPDGRAAPGNPKVFGINLTLYQGPDYSSAYQYTQSVKEDCYPLPEEPEGGWAEGRGWGAAARVWLNVNDGYARGKNNTSPPYAQRELENATSFSCYPHLGISVYGNVATDGQTRASLLATDEASSFKVWAIITPGLEGMPD
jgi:hypothetical protein